MAAADKPELKFNWDAKDAKAKWEAFSKFGAATATEMTGKNFDKWLKDAGVLDPKGVTTTVTGIAFSKVTGTKKKATFPETKQVLIRVAEDRASQTKKPVQDELDVIIEKLAKLEAPTVNSAAKANADGVYSRLTDHTKYTGAHKERFNTDGSGKGKAGREELIEQTGYVASYKNKDTYDKAHGAAK
ncbi:tppp-1 [Pristionchus pacificus]|uniref:Tppp-1 n=1 Tax=Pristionchus pacificus TaxID=54126 RepID=A0A454XSQ0_PRIPA|nr:tppp-1 [Pristionchus pacificus]|eukprot:PDM69456.1 tppp-1 [Pristionchus pacificus]